MSQDSLLPVQLTPADGRVDDILIEELVYVALDEATGDLLLLDKSNDIYRYTAQGEWRVEILAAPIPGQFPDPQYLALAVLDDDIYALDADLSNIWRFSPGATLPESYFAGAAVADGVDMTLLTAGPERGALYVLTRAGRIVYIAPGGRGRTISEPPLAVTWPGQIAAVGAQILVIDGDSRSISALDASVSEDEPLATFRTLAYRFPEMPRLRSMTISNRTLLALAGSDLYLTDLSAVEDTSGAECPHVAVDNTLYFHGRNIDQLLTDFALPFPNAVLPDRPRSYPGARRLYRFGIHTGMDLYANDAGGLGFGSPVSAIGDGVVIRIDHDYAPISAAEFDAALAQTEAEHRTNPEMFELFMGRQVQLRHSRQVSSIYGHLESTPADILAGARVEQGTPIGTVGVTGTSSGAYGYIDGAHLHYEIWIDDRYLGQGLSLYETMRIWQAIFN